MVLLSDNDIILKLAAFNLLDQVQEALDGEEIYVLDAARHRLRRPSKKTLQTHSSDTIQRALDWCEAARPLTEEPYSQDTDALLDAVYEDEEGSICRIDGGELILFSNTFRRPQAKLLTGDKKALYALGRHRFENTHAATIHQELTERVICLEASIELCIAGLGFTEVCERVRPALHSDSMMRMAFSHAGQESVTTALGALNSYCTHLEKTVGVGWLWRYVD